MKKIILISLIGIILTGCTSNTEYGPCVGAFDDKDPKKIYKVSINNLIMGIIFLEFIAPPITVLVDETFCPIGDKK